MKNLHLHDEQERQYWENLKNKIASAFPHAGNVEDKLNPRDTVYTFNAECYRDTGKAILIWHDMVAKITNKNCVGRAAGRFYNKCKTVCSHVAN